MQTKLWTIVRFPDGTWSGGGKPSDMDYKNCEVYRIPGTSYEDARRKAQGVRSRLAKKEAALPTQAEPYYKKVSSKQ